MKQTVFFKSILLVMVMLLSYMNVQAQEAYAVMTAAGDFSKLTFYYDDQKASRNGMDIGPFNSAGEREWHDPVQSMVRYVEFDSSFANYTELTSTAYWFCNFKQLREIKGLENLNTSKVTDMSWMFYNCEIIPFIDLSHLNTSKVTDMSWMFHGCGSVVNMDLSHFDTSSVTDMNCMFAECQSLPSLDLRSFNTSNVEKMYKMFAFCYNLTNLDLTSFNTSAVRYMDYMFASCTSLHTLNLSSFDTSNVDNMDGMFNRCSSLTTIFGTNWDTSKVVHRSQGTNESLFYDCYKLTGGNGTRWYRTMEGDEVYCRIDGGPSAPGYFTYLDPTGIQNPVVAGSQESAPVYDLQGRRVDSPSRRGVYIKDGRKIIR